MLATLLLLLTTSPLSAGETRIIGGTPVTSPELRTRYPYTTSLQWGGHRCGGTLVAVDLVLTAAHCVYIRSVEVPHDRSLDIIVWLEILNTPNENTPNTHQYLTLLLLCTSFVIHDIPNEKSARRKQPDADRSGVVHTLANPTRSIRTSSAHGATRQIRFTTRQCHIQQQQ